MLLVNVDLMEYSRSLELQRSLVQTRLASGLPDVVLLVQHPPTITLGSRGKSTDLLMCQDDLASFGIAVHSSDRGGQATFHGPGQLVVYPVMDLKARRLSARAYVHALEETVLKTLHEFGVKGFRRPHNPGIWIGEQEKIASIGVRIRRGITSHGFSLNVALQQDPSRYIVCCGMPETKMISINDLLPEPLSMHVAREATCRAFAEVFQVVLEPYRLIDLRQRMV